MRRCDVPAARFSFHSVVFCLPSVRDPPPAKMRETHHIDHYSSEAGPLFRISLQFTAVGHRGARGRLWKPPSRSVYFDLLPSVPLRTSSPTLWDEINDVSHSNATKGILIILIGSFSREMSVKLLLCGFLGQPIMKMKLVCDVSTCAPMTRTHNPRFNQILDWSLMTDDLQRLQLNLDSSSMTINTDMKNVYKGAVVDQVIRYTPSKVEICVTNLIGE